MRKKIIKILHTSDWHLGHSLYSTRRDQEFSAFLDWMVETIDENQIDVLLVSGDVFDSGNPGNAVCSQYYGFLRRLLNTSCQHVVVTAGNHDSPSFLNAPADILKIINVHTVAYAGSAMEGVEGVGKEVLVLRDSAGEPFLIVGAVPFLPDRVLRTMESGEDSHDREAKVREAVKAHYDAVAAVALQKRKEFGADFPIVAMGHLYAAGGKVTDGVRDLYVGGLGQVTAGAFSDVFDYVALGHLHVPQKVGGIEHIRYCGSPLPMGFNEASQVKQVCIVTFEGNQKDIRTLDVPVFQRLERIEGDWDTVMARLDALKAAQENVWVEVVYTGERIADLAQNLHKAVKDTAVRILRIQNENLRVTAFGLLPEGETLENLSPETVFDRLLDKKSVAADKRKRLKEMYAEILLDIQQVPEDREQV